MGHPGAVADPTKGKYRGLSTSLRSGRDDVLQGAAIGRDDVLQGAAIGRDDVLQGAAIGRDDVLCLLLQLGSR
ncbi:MAG: hypothetical protein BGO25_05315 [Acidobacteriales bacterium 59-55]|nr:MAG: hypothetical protein BGO25_05315 [Acidobacteriales bacterium 59-55]